MPADYTAVDSMDDRTRHRLIANGWHCGVASRLLLMLVFATFYASSEAMPTPAPSRTTLQ